MVRIWTACGVMAALAIATAAPSWAESFPRTGRVLKMTNGDLMCYLELRDRRGQVHSLGADFDICAQEQKFLGKRVRLTYKKMRVNDCESAEPCGKTKVMNLVSRLRRL